MKSSKPKKTQLRQRRLFSEESKKQIVKDIEQGKYTVLQASREHGVAFQTVYQWLYRYSRHLQKNKILVVEEQSEQRMRKDLEQRIKDLEAALGRKQMEIDMLNKLIEIANQEYQTDLKKKHLKTVLEWFRINKGIKHRHPMKELYSIAGISKQAIWSHNRREQERMDEVDQVVGIIKNIRKNNKRMGCRRMYYVPTNASSVGRDRFEQIGLENGFRVQRKRNVAKTTWSQRVEIYPNLIEGRVINGMNQVWQSDIFYIKVEGKDHYGVTIIDVYTRRLLALLQSDSLSSDQLLKALKMAIRARKGSDLSGCIFHSDRGSQYIAKGVKALLNEHNMQGSMCLLPQENAYVERVQGSIKHEYLYEMDMILEGLQSQSRKVVSLYNNHRPHSSLGMMTPASFERYVQNLDENQRPEMKIYQWDHELSTKSAVFNKKKKEAKKKKLFI